MAILKKTKIFIKLLIRFVEDLFSTDLFKFAKKRKNKTQFSDFITITQEIKPSETFQNKVFNLSLAANRINEYEIFPNEIFSFWKIIGNPNHDFKKGRTLQNGQIKEEVGGGICQVSGIVYHVSILAGLQILERHNHSVDIYTDETRFTALGLDATVVFGYKDLRIQNNFDFPIKFKIEVIKNQINIELLSTQKIKENQLFFEKQTTDEGKIINVLNENRKLINSSMYRTKGI